MKDLTVHGSGLDQPPVLDKAQLADALREVDNIVDRCIEQNSPDEALAEGKRMMGDIQVKGVQLARMLDRLSQHWAKFGLEESFKSRIVAEWGMNKDSVNQYLNIQRNVLDNKDIPQDVRDKLLERPMHTLGRLTRPARERVLNDDEWEEVTRLPDHRSVGKFVDEKMGKSPKGRPALTLHMYEDGVLVAMEGNTRTNLGKLKVDDEAMANSVHRRAIERIIRNSGILEF